MADELRNYIDGEWMDARDGARFDVVDPATEEVIATAPDSQRADAEAAVAAARRAFDGGPWPRASERERERVLLRAAEIVRRESERLAELETRDSGKPLAEAREDIDEAAFMFEYYGGWATKVMGEIPPVGPDALSLVVKEPVGVAALITPWNYPLLMAVQKVAPALAAGCTFVLKPAEQTPLTALELPAILEEAGVPPGVANVIAGFGPTAGAPLVEHPDVDKVGFTGSVEVGKEIMRTGADTLKRVTLELGGKSPNIIFADASFEEALEGTAAGIFGNQGEICSAGSRIFVERPIYDDALDSMRERAGAVRLGHGLDEGTTMGPLVSREQRDRVLSYIEAGKAEGAKLATEASPGFEAGYFVPPTVFYDVTNDMRIAREEIFGPVAAVLPFDDPDEVVRLSNDTTYGLAAAVWTRDITKALRTARALRAGVVWINDSQP
ncbi:MAG TPA: aldehyde dehydrogenase family protein, partial [Actinomycetota bacterium]|nr:aldehyde dehydrogenase family protein [Actinomycetota bacterium]